MAVIDLKIRWGAQQRLEFIEFKAYWEGGIRRGDLKQQFGVSVPQASIDLNAYQKIAPENLKYDSTAKRYVATPDFVPRYIKADPGEYLSRLSDLTTGAISLADSWLATPVSTGLVPIPKRRVDPKLLRDLISTINAERSVEILYQSMDDKNPEPLWRRISPHTFGNDGFRWHVRAYCHRDSQFKDFLVSRCFGVRDEASVGAPRDEDHLWNSFFSVVLIPNPELSIAQQRSIAIDYLMENGQLDVPVRCAMLYYFEKRLRLDVAAAIDRPAESPIIVKNKEEFTTALEKARTLRRVATR